MAAAVVAVVVGRNQTGLSPPLETTYADVMPVSDDAARRRWADFLTKSHAITCQGPIIGNYVTCRSSLAHPRRLGHAGTRRLTLTPTWKLLKAPTSEFN